ncbi:hypothetical protein CAPTEDRAFT_185304 [Capitella teleta]|nr:hypothetical protein CAPTEDRAFT_185304 [Capitella teleta]|eukprot:ELU13252.1 hypothetical protein CAPTEDRAFT_185304 [Capitella teleta]
MQKQQQEVQAFFCALMSSILVTKKEIRDARANPDALLAWLAFYKKLHGDVSSQLHQNLSLPNTPQEHSKLNQWLRQQKRLLVNQRKAGKTTTVEAKQGRRPRKAGKTTTVEAKDESEDEVVVVREFMTINYYHSSG